MYSYHKWTPKWPLAISGHLQLPQWTPPINSHLGYCKQSHLSSGNLKLKQHFEQSKLTDILSGHFQYLVVMSGHHWKFNCYDVYGNSTDTSVCSSTGALHCTCSTYTLTYISIANWCTLLHHHCTTYIIANWCTLLHHHCTCSTVHTFTYISIANWCTLVCHYITYLHLYVHLYWWTLLFHHAFSLDLPYMLCVLRWGWSDMPDHSPSGRPTQQRQCKLLTVWLSQIKHIQVTTCDDRSLSLVTKRTRLSSQN